MAARARERASKKLPVAGIAGIKYKNHERHIPRSKSPRARTRVLSAKLPADSGHRLQGHRLPIRQRTGRGHG